MRQCLADEPATLFVVGSYHIGKERAYLGAAQQLGLRVRCVCVHTPHKVLRVAPVAACMPCMHAIAATARLTHRCLALCARHHALLLLKVFAPPAKRRLLALLDLPPEQLALLTDDKAACVHVGGMGATPERLTPLLGQGRWRQVVGFRPTGVLQLWL